MEVGAVKQAFNNEVILLKRNLNQARTQIIHKLTRKAKTLTEKKTPEQLKEKLKKKAESAVNEVLIMKKIKPRDIAKFSITHKGELKQYLNKPQVDKDKACARLLLHKALQDKYKFIRGRFGGVPIQDLFMSRQERRKLKKEQKEQQKNKKKDKNKNLVNSEGDWNVEEIEMAEEHKAVDDSNASDHDLNSESEMDENEQKSDSENEIHDNDQKSDSENEIHQSNNENEIQQSNNELKGDQSVKEESTNGMFVKLKPSNEAPLTLNNKANKQTNKKGDKLKQKNRKEQKISVKDENIETAVIKKIKPIQNKTVARKGKNKNLNEKLQTKKFKKHVSEDLSNENKVIDPFFITSTGENYLSLAEPRQPDEIKEIHKQGNRKERRAAMFGHIPKIKPRRDDSRQNFNNKFDKRNSDTNRNDNYKDDNFKSNFNRFSNNKERFNDNSKFNKKFNDNSSFDNNRSVEKEVKLHPSWEAKKKQSTIVPFQDSNAYSAFPELHPYEIKSCLVNPAVVV